MVCAASERETDGGVEEAAVAYSGRMGIGIAVAEADEERRFWLFDERIDAERDVIVGVFPVGVAHGATNLEDGFADVEIVVAEAVGQTAAQADAFERCVMKVGVDVFDACQEVEAASHAECQVKSLRLELHTAGLERFRHADVEAHPEAVPLARLVSTAACLLLLIEVRFVLCHVGFVLCHVSFVMCRCSRGNHCCQKEGGK